MPDFEIRYYHADGKLALVHMCILKTLDEAREFAQVNLKDFARFEVRNGDGTLIAARHSGIGSVSRPPDHASSTTSRTSSN